MEEVKKKKSVSFMKNVLMLMIAQVLIKVLGFLYRLVIINIEGFGDVGNGYYSTGYQIYALLLTLSSVGIPTVISKLVSERVAIGDHKSAHRIFKVALENKNCGGLILNPNTDCEGMVNISVIKAIVEYFKKNELDKCKSDRERKRFNKRTQELDNIIRRKKEEFQFFLDIGGINRCIEGDAKECERASSTCRNTHTSNKTYNKDRSPLLIIEDIEFRLDDNMFPVRFKTAEKMADIDIVMEAFEAAEKEKQLAEERRAREKEARKIARERQQAEKDLLAAQKNLEEQKIQEAKNEKLRAEAEALNKARAQAQAEKEELEKLEAARAELAALKEQLEAAKIKEAVEAQNKAEYDAIQREREEVERQQEKIRLQKQKEAEEKAKREAEEEAKREAERQKFALTDKVISGCQKLAVPVGMSHTFYSNQVKYGTSTQKKEAEVVLSYTNELIEILDETIKLCNKGKETGNVAPCESKGVENLNKASYRMLELNKVLDEIGRRR